MKKCPHCGRPNPVALTDYELNEESSDNPDYCGYYTVVCPFTNAGCGATGGYRKTKKEAIENWNRRVK